MKNPPFIRLKDHSLHPFCKNKFTDLTGALFIDQMLTSTPLNEDTYSPLEQDIHLATHLLPLFEKHKQYPKALCIVEQQSASRLALHAHESINAGEIVTEYLGEFLPAHERKSSYRWGPIDALHFRNEAALVEDGFPNLAAFYLYGIDGIALRVVFVAIEPIKAGDLLTIHYGMCHSVKVHTHTEYRVNEMTAFFKELSLKEIFEKIRAQAKVPRNQLTWNENIELENLIAKVQYLYQTPSALLWLLLKGVVSKEEIFYYFDKPDIRVNLLGFRLIQNLRQQEIYEMVHLLKRANVKDPHLMQLLQMGTVRELMEHINS